jgi:hypothetical protein
VSYCGSNLGSMFQPLTTTPFTGSGGYQEDVKAFSSSSSTENVKSNNFSTDAGGGGNAWGVELNVSAGGGMDLLNIDNCSDSETYMFVYIKKEIPML